MQAFEIMYILKYVDDSIVNEIVNKYSEFIANAGELIKTDKWGKKRLAYEIQDLHEGYYILTTFNATPKVVRDIHEKMEADENVLRHMILRKA